MKDIHFGWGYNAIVTTLAGANTGLVSSLETALPNTWPTSLKLAGSLPEVGWGGWGGLTPYGSSQTIWTSAPYGNHEDLYTIQDNLSKVSGNHVYKVGAFYGPNAKIENNNGGTDRPVVTPFDGPIAGTGPATGNPLANILIPGTGSKPQQFQMSENSINVTAREIWHDFEWYLADSWKIRRNLTLEYGFRWSFLREPTSEGNAQAGWSLGAWSAAQAAAHPSDACNGVIIVTGAHPCQDAVAALVALGVNLTLSNVTPSVNSIETLLWKSVTLAMPAYTLLPNSRKIPLHSPHGCNLHSRREALQLHCVRHLTLAPSTRSHVRDMRAITRCKPSLGLA